MYQRQRPQRERVSKPRSAGAGRKASWRTCFLHTYRRLSLARHCSIRVRELFWLLQPKDIRRAFRDLLCLEMGPEIQPLNQVRHYVNVSV